MPIVFMLLNFACFLFRVYAGLGFIVVGCLFLDLPYLVCLDWIVFIGFADFAVYLIWAIYVVSV